jgi:hypothetical protein
MKTRSNIDFISRILFGWDAGFPNICQKIPKQKLLNQLFRRMTQNKKARPGWVVLILCFS